MPKKRTICRMPGCEKDGLLALRGRPRVKFCEEHFKAVVKRIVLITRAMRRIERRNQADDNRPARQPASIQ